ncbi:MAG: hypothetical protein PHU21_13880, partial [Elusimicrobia bacterium]|nr:hypothetical protein [Elusimicrobiota bacterium]
VNGRRFNAETGMSLHTLSLRRGLRVGAHAFSAKMEYHFDYLQQKEVLIVAESPIGFRRWMIEYNLEKRFQVPHELGGPPSWSLTRPLFEKARGTLITGHRPVPATLLAKAKERILPPSDPPTPPQDLMAATRSLGDNTGTALLLQRQLMAGFKPGEPRPAKTYTHQEQVLTAPGPAVRKSVRPGPAELPVPQGKGRRKS